MQLGLAVRQARREQVPPNVCIVGMPAPIAKYFPFKFTDDQADAVHDIYQDLHGPKAMNRLLQGDVGCGKTAVAAYAAIVTAFNGAQTAILCPTEILARQHYETVKEYFERAGVRCDLVVSGAKQYTQVVYTHQPGYHADIVIGTTALLSEGACFRNLGLVIIDEQHKFGVEQRAALRRHGNPHVLVMTATPIPRTMAMTVFGDLNVSTIRSMPPGRVPTITKWCNDYGSQLDARLYMERELSAGHQIYIVCPRIEALDDEMRAVEEVSREYQVLFPGVPVEPLHGKMTQRRKDDVTHWWANPVHPCGAILVSTTVVEVGVDNPNATVMVIEGAERFGLAQLHQLRGRVGRGPAQSYCFLLSDTESAEARSRLQAMERTNDGFEIAEQDLRLRGPGDLLSTKQHGLPELRIADLVEDYDLLVETRREAREMVAKGPLPASVQAELERRFGSNLNLGDAA
jgi:ATP-dependent DNA helicase RecG